MESLLLTELEIMTTALALDELSLKYLLAWAN
jgi:hypothetical protein